VSVHGNDEPAPLTLDGACERLAKAIDLVVRLPHAGACPVNVDDQRDCECPVGALLAVLAGEEEIDRPPVESCRRPL
jgi:hypothetical protein